MTTPEERDLDLVAEPVDVVVGANPTQQVVLVEVYASQGVPGPVGPMGPQGPPGALPPVTAADLGEAVMVRDQGAGATWVNDRIQAADVNGLGALATLDTVGSAQIGTAAVTVGKLAANSVGTIAIQNGAVITQDLADGAVTSAKLAAGAVTGNLGYTPLNAANNLSDLTNFVTARANLGVPTGTSGHVLPFLDTACVWSGGTQVMQITSAGAVINPLRLTNAAAWADGQGVELRLSPAVAGVAGVIRSQASGAANNADLSFYTYNAGSGVQVASFAPNGAFALSQYHSAGLLQNDSVGNVSSTANPSIASLTLSQSSAGNNIEPLTIQNTAAGSVGAAAGMQLYPTAGAGYGRFNAYRDGADNSTGLQWGVMAAGSLSYRMTLSSAGALNLGAYGAGILVSDASGNITTPATAPPISFAASATPVAIPLQIYNSHAWSAGQGVDFRIGPAGTAYTATIRSRAQVNSNDADLEFFTYSLGTAYMGLACLANGDVQIGDHAANIVTVIGVTKAQTVYAQVTTGGGALGNPLLVQNNAPWAAGQGVEVRLVPNSNAGTGNIGGVIRSIAQTVNNDADLQFYVYSAGGAYAAMMLSKVGAVRLPQYAAGTLTTDSSGNVTASSDARVKTVLRVFRRSISDLRAMGKPVLYTWKHEEESYRAEGKAIPSYAGWVAQDVRTGIPEAVFENQNVVVVEGEEGLLSLHEQPIIATLFNAVLELAARVEALEQAPPLRTA
jgi:hypothetical protein